MCMSSVDSTPNTFRELIAFLQFPSRHYDPKLLFHVIIVVCRLDYKVSFFFPIRRDVGIFQIVMLDVGKGWESGFGNCKSQNNSNQ